MIAPMNQSGSVGMSKVGRLAGPLLALAAAAGAAVAARAADVPPEIVLADQARRIGMIARVSPAVVCVYDAGRRGGGAGVLIDETGLGLTNYHVAAAMLDTRRGWGGLPDGQLYELEVLGIDPTGDVAAFRLHGLDAFPHAELGDSDAVRVGDEVVAMGNPFILSEDYTPTVTLGLITGVHRYQWGVGNNLIYSDCIQVDAAINPGNSGGPLFGAAGRVIGINGRISVNTRGRFNVGFGYAISSNQIKRFLPALRAGLLAMHGTLAVKVDVSDRLRVVEVAPDGAAERAGIREGDALLAIDGVAITSPNHFVSVLGTYPARWHMLVETLRDGETAERIVRLDPIEPDLHVPFEVDPDVNRREVMRVLTAHRRSVLGANEAAAPGYSFRLARRTMPASDRETPDVYRVAVQPAGPVRMERTYDDGTTGRIIEYDDTHAVRRADVGAEPFDLPAWDRMICASLYLAQSRLLQRLGDLDASRITHAGGDVLLRRRDENGGIEATEVEVLDWTLGDFARARLSFDSSTALLLRIEATDAVSGSTTTLDMWDHEAIDGIKLPSRVDVLGGSRGFRDLYSERKRRP